MKNINELIKSKKKELQNVTFLTREQIKEKLYDLRKYVNANHKKRSINNKKI